MGRSSPLVADAIPWGHASGPAGLAPEALQECGCSCKGFYTRSAGVRGVSFSRHWPYSSRLGGATRTRSASSVFGAP
jgi:hypothetical protein